MKVNRPLVYTGGLVLCFAVSGFAQNDTPPALAPVATQDRVAESPVITERGAHHRVWRTPGGGSYTELADGVCYEREGQWTEAEEIIEIIDGKGVARRGNHQVVFEANINTPGGTIDLLTPDGHRFVSKVFGIVLYDAASGQSALIGQLQDSIGQVVSSNQVIYENAFSGLKADLRYSWRRGSFEQDVIVRELPAGFSPRNYRMDPATVRMEIWTEMLQSPTPRVQTIELSKEEDPQRRAAMAEPDFNDQILDFGQMHIGSGLAFALHDEQAARMGQPNAAVRVGKSWQTLAGGRKFLIEGVQYPAIKPLLDTLPVMAQANPLAPIGGKAERFAVRSATTRSGLLTQIPVPERRLNKPGEPRMLMAGAQPSPRPGVAWDYTILNGSSGVTLKADTTYYVTGPVTLSGTTTIEGGTVVKYKTNASASITIGGYYPSVNCLTGPYRPAVFTAESDHSVGEVIPNSGDLTGSGYYATYALNCQNVSGTDLKYLRIKYASVAINFYGTYFPVLHSQIINCNSAFSFSYYYIYFRNVLIANEGNYTSGSVLIGTTGTEFRGEHLTVDRASLNCANTTVRLTNSVLVGVTVTGGNYQGGAGTVEYPVSPTIFQPVLGGKRYIVHDAFRDGGVFTITAIRSAWSGPLGTPWLQVS